MDVNIRQAKTIITERNGTPTEDDWTLAEAAKDIASVVEVFAIRPPSRELLAGMTIGESCVFKEPIGTVNVGASCQSYAHRAGVKITTSVCYIISPTHRSMDCCVVVTRLPD